MAKGEVLQLSVTQRETRGNGQDFYAPPVQSNAHSTTDLGMVRRDEHPGKKGLLSRRLSDSETIAIAEFAKEHSVDPRRVSVERFSEKGKRRKLDVEELQNKLSEVTRNEAHVRARDTYHKAREEENQAIIASGLRDPLFLQSAEARVAELPISHLEHIYKSLLSGNPDDSAFEAIEDNLRAAVYRHFPEYNDKIDKWIEVYLRIVRWKPLAYATSFVPTILDGVLDIPQILADRKLHKSRQRIRADHIIWGFDFVYSPTVNLATAGPALDRMDDVVTRADLNISHESFTTPDSTNYKYRARFAQAIARAVPPGITLASVDQHIGDHIQELDTSSFLKTRIGFSAERLNRRDMHLRMQRKIALTAEEAREILKPPPAEASDEQNV